MDRSGRDPTPETTFTRLKLGRARVIVRDDFRPHLEGLKLHEPSFRPPPSSVMYQGRGEVFALPVPEWKGGRAVVRHYHHGGLSGIFFRRWFVGPSRAVREFLTADEAYRAGVPTVRPLAAITFRFFGPFYRALFVSEEIKGGRDLFAVAEASRFGEAPPLKRVSMAAARAVRKMHDLGFYHADLNLKNILVAEEGARAAILDWDLASRRPAPLERELRIRNLRRLDRSVRKIASGGTPIPVRERLRFLKHYFAPGGVDPPTKGELRRWALASKMHAFAWLVEALGR
ncbi:MAG: lipopolysaccharide kinase InaA family protein [Planctomycetota bacterium]|jgi:3-deoxy-D-manno-octulosonic acid kinase